MAGMSGLDGRAVYILAICITVLGLLSAGSMKRYVTGVNWLKSGLEMLGIGFLAFSISYIIGLFIPGAGILTHYLPEKRKNPLFLFVIRG